VRQQAAVNHDVPRTAEVVRDVVDGKRHAGFDAVNACNSRLNSDGETNPSLPVVLVRTHEGPRNGGVKDIEILRERLERRDEVHRLEARD